MASADTDALQDQWKRTKQTKEEAKAAKMGRLDPDSLLNRNAKEVLDERARNKRKLREMQEVEDESSEVDDEDIGVVDKEKPGQGLKKKQVDEDGTMVKKQKVADEDQISNKEKARAEKALLKKQKKEKKKEEERKNKEPQVVETEGDSRKKKSRSEDKVDKRDTVEVQADEDEELQAIEISGLGEQDEEEDGSSAAASEPPSPIFDSNTSNVMSGEPASTTTSVSSVVAPSEKPKHIKLPTDTTALRARLAARIEALRAARKADGEDGRPIRTRQELIEARREKQVQRKAHKKELRRKAKEEEERKREEALASARNSPGGSMLSPLVGLDEFDEEEEEPANNFSFGRVAFTDGTQMAHDLTSEKTDGKKKRKGSSDPKTALAMLEAQKKRIAGMDEDKRKEVLEKETWLAARRRAEGEKVHDDEALLKKSVKRKERAKKKTDREWKERTRGVETAMRDRQRKREENIRKRRDDKLNKGKGKKKTGPKKNRPGFEGSLGFGSKRK
jgi:hypothetical protein